MVVNLLRMLLFDDKPLKAQCRISPTVLPFPVTALGGPVGMMTCHFICLCRLRQFQVMVSTKGQGKKKKKLQELKDMEEEISSKLL